MLEFQKTDSPWDNQKKLCHFFRSDHCIGVDEAGRGALAGPVVAAAVCFKPGQPPFFLDDSKKLSIKKREQSFDEIIKSNAAFGIGICSSGEIDQKNILQATYLVMQDALKQCLKVLSLDSAIDPPLVVAIDGNRSIPAPPVCQTIALIGGDSLIASIAAASILAKVTRDRLMLRLDQEYPDYGFSRHKGYGTQKHIRAIQEFGVSPQHRLSFHYSLRS